MASALKCDACGKLYDIPEHHPDIRVSKCMHPYGDTYYDLCPECQKKLEAFVEGVKND